MTKKIIKQVENYYTDKIKTFGATSQGVDWNGHDSHFLRLEQLSKLFPTEASFSILDYGSGFGSLIEYLNQKSFQYEYLGYDISEEMVNKGLELHKAKNIDFTTDINKIPKVDYVIANGLFNVKLETPEEEWKDYILKTIKDFDKYSEKGFAFNILTSYSDEEYKKDYLHYSNPLEIFDFCKKIFSRNVALLHDYELYEFTIIVRK